MGSEGTILIVDDRDESLELLSNILEAEGYQVHAANSGELALAAVAASPPELILLDLQMPGMDGFEVSRKLKSRVESRDIPVIFLTASGDFEDRLEGLESGAVDFVSKPFRREELLSRLKNHLQRARFRKDLEQRVAERTRALQDANHQLQRELELRTRIEGELRESEQLFHSMADAAPAVIWITQQDGLVRYVNQWGLAFFGCTLEQMAVSPDWLVSLIHSEDRSRVTETRGAARLKRQPYQFEYRLLRSDGEYRWVTTTGTPFFVNGEFDGYIGLNIDVTELKRTGEQVLANQKLESLGALTAGIAHTFNNLASTILAHSELALDEIPKESIAHESVSTIATVALRASEIVSLLMAYAGQGESDTPEPVELSALTRETVQLVRATFPQTTSLAVSLSKTPTVIWASAGQIRQVVLSLIMNGFEALEGRTGAVTVSTAPVRVRNGSDESGFPALREGDYVLLEVSDTGRGMTEDTKSRIFDPFFSTKSLGRGLGLASVQGIVRGTDGVITVVSSPGQGSSFKVWWPCWGGW